MFPHESYNKVQLSVCDVIKDRSFFAPVEETVYQMQPPVCLVYCFYTGNFELISGMLYFLTAFPYQISRVVLIMPKHKARSKNDPLRLFLEPFVTEYECRAKYTGGYVGLCTYLIEDMCDEDCRKARDLIEMFQK